MYQTKQNTIVSPLPLADVRISDRFWSRYTRLVTERILPYQYQVLNDQLPDTPESSCIRNFRIAAGLEEGKFHGWVFQDTDLAKWLEAAAYSLNYEKNPELERTMDDLVDLIGRAQQENGYLNTYFSTLHPGHQYCNLKEGHELYTAGHFIEAAVAYYQATGKGKLLSIMERCADHIVDLFHRPDYADAVPGHEEIELALMKLAKVTGKQEYARMAMDFIDRRGTTDYLSREHTLPRFVDVWHDPNPYIPQYGQAHKPVRQQRTAEGHAVRALYLFTAVADLAGWFADAQLLETCEAIYENITQKRMYLTGGVGSSGVMERFTADYDLPNDTAYAESCASIALMMFCTRMAAITGEAKYMDTAEQALLNTVLGGVSLDGQQFFYVNPLEVVPSACLSATDKNHVKPRRQSWFGCACCPPNIARTLASLGTYAYSAREKELRLNLYLSGSCRGEGLSLEVESELPFAGRVKLRAVTDSPGQRLLLRIPGYAEHPVITVDGKAVQPETEKGYAVILITQTQTQVELTFQMPPRLIYASPHVPQDNGKCAVKKGPLVYCLEEADNGSDLAALLLDTAGVLEEEFCPDLLGGTLTIKAKGYRLRAAENALYTTRKPTLVPTTLCLIPYPYWGNREPGEMAVWIRYIP